MRRAKIAEDAPPLVLKGRSSNLAELTPHVSHSAYLRRSRQRPALAAGFDVHLTRPVTEAALSEVLARAERERNNR